MEPLYIKDFEALTHQQVVEMLPIWLSQLDYGGTLEFACLNFAYVIDLYACNHDSLSEVSTLLFEGGRRAVWSEISIARMLLLNGFAKVWTGRVEEYPKHMFYVKAMKLVSTSFI